MDGLSFHCPKCNQKHIGLPALAYAEPIAPDKDDHSGECSVQKINDDFRIFDRKFFFVRAVLKIPITGGDHFLEWGVWGSLSEPSFQQYWDSFDDHDQSKIGGMFSYLSNEMDGYPGSLALRCDMMPQDDRKRPLLLLQKDQDHPLVHDQRNGITINRAIELAMPILHPQGEA